MARTKYSERFCGYCNKATRMEFVGEMEGRQDKMWFRCTRCHHTSLMDITSTSSANDGKIDATTATPYNPLSTFKVGEAIFHTEWNDVGKVMSKNKTSDGSQSIIVSFEKTGQRRLIENLKPEIADNLVTT
ncbi:MAG TPA: hypothetical protein VKI62_01875 [Bacteroidota bacterium]|nr:hypothetical protein [Bacteroidota bacterium]